MAVNYPAAHLLSLPLELRETIYDYLAEDRPVLHLKDDSGSLHLSAAHTQPLNLLQAHPLLCEEALSHFHRTQRLTIHVDAFAFAKLGNQNAYRHALQSNRYVQRSRNIEIRYVMNAHVDFLVEAIKHVVATLILPTSNAKSVTITWAEVLNHVFQRTWRPWACKIPALEPLWDLLDHVDVQCGGVVNAPPATAELQNNGFTRSFNTILKYKSLSGDKAQV
ncbi:uncharacterized protein PV09_04499 [Verruconis gallopava]|uniref:F-box domain-containing protein n=1 Tax=Verruconis gallopava TaxID=253628 RepID=A0A0D2ACG0_9PEZI|nr:uncharacterized protein PV09_04499 [Verruconis gallopava]KIW04190.1 hypothetical protein PV09_04499 [Verruconis gallopava]